MKICECGKQVASNATSCPSCAHRFTHPFLKAVAILFGAFVGFVVLIVILTNNSKVTTPLPTDAAQAPSTGNILNDKLLALTEKNQEVALGKIIVEEECGPNRVFFMGMDKMNDAFWSVGCASGQSYEVEIHPDAVGSTKELNCSTLRAIAHVNCFERFSEQQ